MVMVLLFCFSGWLAMSRRVPLKMLPFDNKNEFQVVVDMPEGATLETTESATAELASYLRGVPEVTDVTTYVGTSSPMDFNGMVRHYYLRRGPNVADIRVRQRRPQPLPPVAEGDLHPPVPPPPRLLRALLGRDLRSPQRAWVRESRRVIGPVLTHIRPRATIGPVQEACMRSHGHRALLVCVPVLAAVIAPLWAAPSALDIVRGDCLNDGSQNLSDVVTLLTYLFPLTTPPTLVCDDACDINDDGSLNLQDAILLLNWLFVPGPAPPAPPTTCGVDPTADTLACGMFSGC